MCAGEGQGGATPPTPFPIGEEQVASYALPGYRDKLEVHEHSLLPEAILTASEVDAKLMPDLHRRLGMEFDCVWFTDGSLINQRAAAAAYCSKTGYAITTRATGRQSIYRAELVGALLAINQTPLHCSAHIVLDNLAAVKKLQVLEHTSAREAAEWAESDLILAIQEQLHMRLQTTFFSWIKAHVNLPPNEMADELAKHATSYKSHPEQAPQEPTDIVLNGMLLTANIRKHLLQHVLSTHDHSELHKVSFLMADNPRQRSWEKMMRVG